MFLLGTGAAGIWSGLEWPEELHGTTYVVIYAST